jgi:hypothetical protein
MIFNNLYFVILLYLLFDITGKTIGFQVKALFSVIRFVLSNKKLRAILVTVLSKPFSFLIPITNDENLDNILSV